MKIGIIGVGRMGSIIGTVFAELGHDVIFSYSRNVRKLSVLAAAAGPTARAGTPREAVEQSEVVLLAVNWSQLDDALAQAGDMAGKTVVSCCMPLDETDTQLVVAHSDSGAEAIARRLPGSFVVAAFQATPSEVLRSVYEARDRSPRPDMVYVGDDAASKARFHELIEQFGFRAIDAGPLRIARYIEPFGLLATALAYGTNEGPEWVYRFGRLQ